MDRYTDKDVRAQLKLIEQLARMVNLIDDGTTLNWTPGANGSSPEVWTQHRDGTTGRQPLFIPAFTPRTTRREAFKTLTGVWSVLIVLTDPKRFTIERLDQP